MAEKHLGQAVHPRTSIDATGMAAEAIGEAYELYRDELRRFVARQSRATQNADDLVQEVYVQLLRFPPRQVLRAPQAYLYRIAWHVVNRANQRAQQEPLTYEPSVLERMPGRGGSLWADEVGDELDAEQQLSLTLSQLPRACQAAIVLLKRDGLSYKQIAVELGVSIHTVKKYIARAITHFKTQLKTAKRKS